MQRNERRLPIYSVASDEFERVDIVSNQWKLCMIKIKAKSFKKWLPDQFG